MTLVSAPSSPAENPAGHPRSFRRCPDCPCSSARASTLQAGCRARPPVPSTPPGGRFTSVRFPAPPDRLHRSTLLSGLHPYPPAGAPSAWSSGTLPFRDATSFRSPLRSALHRRGWVQAPSAPLPATTASADFSLRPVFCTVRRPFRRKARSPRVRTEAFTAPPPDLHRLSLGRESFAVICPLALLGSASYPVSVRRRAVSLHASFSATLADGSFPRLALR